MFGEIDSGYFCLIFGLLFNKAQAFCEFLVSGFLFLSSEVFELIIRVMPVCI